MKINADRLSESLATALAPVYLVTGDEPLQLGEAAQAIRNQARAEGVTDRTVLFANRGFDWSELTIAGANLSLFGDRRLIELRLPTGKPDRNTREALEEFLERPADENVLLVVAPRLEGGAARSAWVRRIETLGVVVQVWPIDRDRLPRRIARRAPLPLAASIRRWPPRSCP